MISLAIGILWFALGVLILGCIVYVALWAVRQVLEVPAVVEKVVWAVFLILVLIYLLMTIQGGGGHAPFHWSANIGLPGPAHSVSTG
jgi:hypothetical protein